MYNRHGDVLVGCRRKLLTTAQYIYKTLFQEEQASDITVLMLGKAWRLHKVYISQVINMQINVYSEIEFGRDKTEKLAFIAWSFFFNSGNVG